MLQYHTKHQLCPSTLPYLLVRYLGTDNQRVSVESISFTVPNSNCQHVLLRLLTRSLFLNPRTNPSCILPTYLPTTNNTYNNMTHLR